jgi:hypothetical protein
MMWQGCHTSSSSGRSFGPGAVQLLGYETLSLDTLMDRRLVLSC